MLACDLLRLVLIAGLAVVVGHSPPLLGGLPGPAAQRVRGDAVRDRARRAVRRRRPRPGRLHHRAGPVPDRAPAHPGGRGDRRRLPGRPGRRRPDARLRRADVPVLVPGRAAVRGRARGRRRGGDLRAPASCPTSGSGCGRSSPTRCGGRSRCWAGCPRCSWWRRRRSRWATGPACRGATGGALLAAVPAGSAVGALLIPRLSLRDQLRLLLPLAALSCLPLFATSVNPPPAVAGALWFVAGVLQAYVLTVIAAVTMFTPRERRGRVLGVASAGLQPPHRGGLRRHRLGRRDRGHRAGPCGQPRRGRRPGVRRPAARGVAQRGDPSRCVTGRHTVA